MSVVGELRHTTSCSASVPIKCILSKMIKYNRPDKRYTAVPILLIHDRTVLYVL